MDDCDQQLGVDNLITFLKDSVFVEYFNSFLLLPSFPCHVYYDEQLGIFESVEADCSTPSSLVATSTVYLTHSKLIQFANPSLCEEWVMTHRLPLFIHSDLYSEYRLLKSLTKSSSTFFDTCLQQQDKKTVQQDKKVQRRRHSVMSGRLSAQKGRRRSLPSAGWGRNQCISPLEEKIALLKSKTGMEMFKKFLAGKLGEENLMFWIEAESLKNIQRSIEYISGMKRLREKYLNVFQQLPLTQRRTLSIDKMAACVNELQLSSLENLKQYWYPRFLVKEVSSSVSLPSVKLSSTQLPLDSNDHHHHTRLSYPATPTYKKLPKANSSHQILPASTVDSTSSSMPHLPEPTTRVRLQRASTSDGRDTFRTKYSNRQSIAPTVASTNTGTCGKMVYSKSSEGPRSLSLLLSQDSPRIGGKTDVNTVSSRLDRSKLSSRRIWSRDSIGRDDNTDDAITRSSRLAMYNKYPLVPCSRTSCNLTALELDWSRSQSPVRPPRSPQILSVSGTPVPMEYQSKTIKPDYKSLLKCLSLEKCKAGGFFQRHLELIPNKVNINCLYCWREVQEYKELFLQCSFSISSVEMKAKVIYGRYIFEGSSECISCPAATAENILERMWPAFEDLFDEAEEHVLAVLLKQWEELCELEHQLFESLHNVEPDNDPYTRISYNDELGKLSEECGSSYASLASVGSSYLESENEDEDGDEMQVGAGSPRPLQRTMLAPGGRASSSNVIENANIENMNNGGFKEKPVVKEMAFSDLMTNPRELEYFKMYLNDNKGAVHLMCWMEIEAFRAIPANDKAVRNMKAKQLRTKYFNKTYFFGPSSPATKEVQRQVVDVGGSHKLRKRPTSAVFREAQKHVRLKVEQFVRLFVKTSDFMERVGSKSTKK